MKFLLTSAGITNNSIKQALFDLLGKSPEESTIVYIPTASNIEVGDKKWLIEDLINLYKLNFKSIEITDISAVAENIWKPTLERADIIYFEGGNTYYLMEWLNKSGLAMLLPNLLSSKVYVGVSAGSMVVCPDLQLKTSQLIYEEDLDREDDLPGLNLVDFYFLPHLNSPFFPKLRQENIIKTSKDTKQKIYAMDDESAIKINDDKIEVISEGEWFKIN